MRPIRPLVLGVSLIVGGIAAPFGPSCGEEARPSISPSEVTLSNLDAFKAQLTRDLPIGTSKAQVQAYVTRSGLACVFVEPRGESWGNLFGCRIPYIGLRGPFYAGLQIRIHLDAKGQVNQLFFRVDYL